MQKRLKVLTICSWYPNDLKPTLGNFVQKHAEAAGLFNDNIAMAIFPSEEEKSLRITTNKNDKLTEFVAYYPKQTKGFKPFRLFQNYLQHRKAFRTLFQLVKKEYGLPDIVHLNIVYPLGIWAVWLKWRYGIPFVITENSSGFHVTSDHAYPPIVMKLCQFVVRRASVLMPVSENLKKNLKRLAPKAEFRIISNVVDETLFTPIKAENSRKKLIHISTGVDSIKNLSGMLRVMQRIKNQNISVDLDIVSDGDTAYAKSLCNELKLDDVVKFHSTKTTAEVAEMLSQSDALLMFSNYENFPCVIAESMMCGKPVISSNVNGIPEHVNETNGILVNPRDEEALTKAIVLWYEGKLKFEAETIRAYAEKYFGYRSVGQQFDSVYRSVLKLS